MQQTENVTRLSIAAHRKGLRARSIAAALLLSTSAPCALCANPGIAQAEEVTVDLSIPAQAVATAIVAFGNQAGVTILMNGETIGDARSEGVQGRYTPAAALQAMLQGTKLTFKQVAADTFWIGHAGEAPSAAPQPMEERKTSPGKGRDDSSSIGLEEIRVVARKREESLQRVPVSVAAFQADELESRGVTNLRDLNASVANVTTQGGQSGSTSTGHYFIRGIGQFDFVITTDQSVGVYVDGVYMARTIGAGMDLVDIDHVEVLRGPQGTLFGRNTVAGAIQIITSRPGEETAGIIEATGGSRNHFDGKFSIDLPIVESKVLSKISVASINQDGYIERLATGEEAGKRENLVGRAQVLVKASDDFDLLFSIDGSRHRGNSAGEQMINVRASDFDSYNNFILATQGFPLADSRFITGDPHKTWSNARSGDDQDIWGASLTATYRMGDTELKSITAYRKLEYSTAFDFDGTPYPLAEQDLDGQSKQFSQELQIGGDALEGDLKWLLGAFYFHEKASELNFVSYFHAIVRTGPGDLDFERGTFFGFTGFDFWNFVSQKTNSYAAFGQVTYSFTDKWSVTAGIRYTYEKKTEFSELTGFLERPGGALDENWTNISPRLGLEFQATEDVLLYTSISRGFRSGGFNGRSLAPAGQFPESYDPEKIWAYEAGLKSDLLDHRLRLNAAGFFYNYQDFQGTTLNPDSLDFLAGNIAKLHVWGFEVEAAARPIEPLTLTLGIGRTAQSIEEVDPNALLGQSIRPDTRLINSPKWTLAGSAEYVIDLGNAGSLTLLGNVAYKAGHEFFLPNFPDEHQKGYALVNARVSYAPQSIKNLELQVFVRNLTDKTPKIYAQNTTPLYTGSTVAIFGPPREWGITAKYRF